MIVKSFFFKRLDYFLIITDLVIILLEYRFCTLTTERSNQREFLKEHIIFPIEPTLEWSVRTKNAILSGLIKKNGVLL